MVNKIQEDIEVNKELITNLPRNNVKNAKKVLEKILELQNDYQIKLQDVIKEMDSRFNKYQSYEENKELDNIQKEKEEAYNNLYLLDDSSPYEKSGLSQLLYQLLVFFDNDLDEVNKIIKKIIDKFLEIGIILTANDFCYTYYVSIYMKQFFENSNAEKLRLCFEDIYFKSPTLFKQISLNFKYLYYKNIKKFQNYYNELKNQFLDKQTPKEIYNHFFNLNEKYFDFYLQDEKVLLNKFLTGEINSKNYTKEEIIKIFKIFINKDLTDDDINYLRDVILKLYRSLNEYQGYLKYHFLIDDMKKLYQDKDKYKNISNSKYKELNKKQNNLFKINRKINYFLKKKTINKTKINTLVTSSLEITEELEKLYLEYEDNLFLEKFLNLDENSTLFDMFNLCLESYNYLLKMFKSQDESLEIDAINLEIEKFTRFIRETKFTMLNHIRFLDDKDLDYIIVDKYNLLGLNLNKEDLQNNLDNLLQNSLIILNYYPISIKINLDNINYLLEYGKIRK